jgi:ferredoxin
MLVFPWLAALLLAAHFFRGGEPGLALAAALVPSILLVRRRWASQVVALAFAAGGVEWGLTTARLASVRAGYGEPWGRMALILGAVAAFTWLSAWLVWRRSRGAEADQKQGHAWLATSVFVAVAGLLVWVRRMVDLDLLLLDRFLPGFGGVEILALAVYGGFLAERLRNPETQMRWRVRAWRIFSAVFFGQLLLGLLGFERFLMTGELHLPVPALIAAGPAYRGEGLFMLGLFLSTVALVGPAWCSHLCYIGAWDDAMARARRRPGFRRNDRLRALLALVVIGGAIVLRIAGVGWLPATLLAAAFGLAGVAVMLIPSRRHGVMVHCTVYCPIGLLANLLGKLSPWRVRIDASDCTECMACSRVCRFSALELADIRAGKPAHTCTLCTDCLTSCPQNTIRLAFPGLSPARAHDAFTWLVVVLHVTFLGVARI